jgi:hypothetical protein
MSCHDRSGLEDLKWLRELSKARGSLETMQGGWKVGGGGRVGEARDTTQADAVTETLSTSMPAESEWLLATDLAVTGGAIQ